MTKAKKSFEESLSSEKQEGKEMKVSHTKQSPVLAYQADPSYKLKEGIPSYIMLKILQIAYTANVPFLFWGSPQTGKSATIRHFARCINAKIKIIAPSQRDSVDFSGAIVPKQEEGYTEACPPKWAVLLDAYVRKGQRAILFVDELTTCRPSIQAPLLSVVLDGITGDFKMHSAVRRFAAANPPDEAADGTSLAPPLSSRFVHVQWVDDMDDWAKGFETYWSMSDASQIKVYDQLDEGLWGAARAVVISFLKNNPQFYHQQPKENEPWAGKRTWDFASRCLAAVFQYGYEPVESTLFVTGAVGSQVAGAWSKFVENTLLIDPEQLLKNPDLLPEKDHEVFICLSSLKSYAYSRYFKNHDVWLKCWGIVERLEKRKLIDYACALAAFLTEWAFEYGKSTKSGEFWQLPDIKSSIIQARVAAGVLGQNFVVNENGGSDCSHD